ncbi:MAG: hypothetical protein ACW98K_03360 [Candidatus Kariarchaeaceae archaeon]|jgi:xanthine/uracil permease
MSEITPIPQFLKNTFLAHAVVGIVFGLSYLLDPTIYEDLFDFTMTEPMVYRLVGAAIFALGVASWLAYREINFDKVKILVILEIIFTVLGAIVTVWGLIDDEFPEAAWLNAILLAAFACAFSYSYYLTTEE